MTIVVNPTGKWELVSKHILLVLSVHIHILKLNGLILSPGAVLLLIIANLFLAANSKRVMDIHWLGHLKIYLLNQLCLVLVDQIKLLENLVGSGSLLSMQILQVQFQFLRLKHLDTNQEWCLFCCNEQSAFWVRNVKNHVVAGKCLWQDGHVSCWGQWLVHFLQVVTQELLFIFTF